MQIQVQKMPPEKVYRISVDVGAEGKRTKIKYSNEYDYDVTLMTIVDSEFMTVRQDRVVIPKVPINSLVLVLLMYVTLTPNLQQQRDSSAIIVKFVPMQSPRKESIFLILEEQDSGIRHTLRLEITWS